MYRKNYKDGSGSNNRISKNDEGQFAAIYYDIGLLRKNTMSEIAVACLYFVTLLLPVTAHSHVAYKTNITNYSNCFYKRKKKEKI